MVFEIPINIQKAKMIPRYKYQEAALQVARCSGRGEGSRDTRSIHADSMFFLPTEKLFFKYASYYF